MADQIVSWGGFNSKGTSGMGVTGSFQVSSSANSFFVGGGSVGVGTITPTYTLQVIGTSSIAANFGVGGSNDGTILIGNTIGDGLQLGRQYSNGQTYFNAVGNSTGGYSFRFAGAEKVAIDSSGNTTLSGTLRLAGNGSVQGLTNNSIYVPSGNGGASLIFRENTNGKKIAISSDSSGNTIFYNEQANSNFANSDISMYIVGSSKNVLIGTTTDSARLTVKGSGTTSSTTALLVQNANASSSLVVNDAGYVGIGASPSATSPVYLYQNTGSSISDLEIFHEYPSSLSQRAYTNLTLTSKQLNGNHGSQYVNFKHVGGNVGTFVGGILGFDLYDGGTGYSYFQLQTKVSGQSLATRFAIDNNGNTLLGRHGGNESIIITEPTFAATSPSSTKTIGIVSNNQAAGWGGFGLIIKAGPANNNLSTNLKGGELYLRAGESLGTGGSDILLQIPTPSGSAGTVLNSTYQTAMFISGSGNIGIGTSLPTAKVHISGSSNSVLFEIDSPAVNNIIYVSGSGNVGIGTSTPLSSLHISGASAVLTLTPQSPLPSGVPTGSFAVSSSVPPKPYFYDGTTWNALY